MASSSPVDEQLQITVSRLPDEAGRQVRAGDDTAKLAAQWRGMPATQLGAVTIDAQHAYRTMLDDLEHESAGAAETLLTASTFTELPAFMSAGPIAYAPRADGLAAVALPPQTLPHDDGIDSTSATDLADTAVRSVARHAVGSRSQHTQNGVPAGLDVIGEFDPAKLSATSAGLGAVPMETYFPAQAAGADAASRTALGDQSLLPNENIRGLLSVPPSVITTLSSLSALDDPNRYGSDPGTLRPDSAAPISVVRVRLTGQLGIDPVSRERVRLAAQRIHDATGLDVDVTMGSSPAPVTVTDPAGNFGRPALTLAEMWSKKGVAAVVVAAVDRKSFVLTTLVLLVCALFVAGATAAAVRTRRTQLAVLACLGWPRSRLFTLVLAEVLAIAAAAGIVGAIVAEPVGRLLGIRVSAGSALLAVPAAMGLAAAAAAWPAARAGGAHPGEAVSPAVAVPRRPSRLVGITGLALGNLRRVPGRAVLGASSLAIGVAALVGLAAISTAFHGAVTGSLLGDAVSVQVRGTDYAAAAIAAGLGAATIADVLYVNIRDRAGEYALLHAVGWHDRALGRLVLTEAAAMGAAGALVGVTAATAADTAFAGRFVLSTLVTAGGVALAAVALTLVCAAVPARALRRMPAARLLAEE